MKINFRHRLVPRLLLVPALLTVFIAGCALRGPQVAAPQPGQALPERVARLLQDANLPQDALSAVVLRASDGAPVFEHQPRRAMQPASTIKLLTSIVALERLGPAYRGKTELRTNAEIRDGTLAGDLVLRGLGNPDFDWRALQGMLQSLRFSGVRSISGDLVLDRSWLVPARPDLGVPPFDESPEFRYNVIPDALLLNSNLMQLEIASDDSGMRVGVTPALVGVDVVSSMKVVDRPCADWEDFWRLPDVTRQPDGPVGAVGAGGGRIRITLNGEFPRNCPVTTQISVLDRVEFADRLFRSLWTALGGTFSGVTRDGVGAANSRVLAEHQSRTLAEFNRDIQKRSDNPITRLTYLALGAALPDVGSRPAAAVATRAMTVARSEHVVRQWLQEKAIDATSLVLDNGSGLSRSERISAATLASVLRAARESRWAPEFLTALPIVGVDGAMRRRLADGPGSGVGRIKTGGLRNVVSVAGYMPDANGETCVVVVMLNHDSVKGVVGRPIVDAMLDWVTRTDTRASAPKR